MASRSAADMGGAGGGAGAAVRGGGAAVRGGGAAVRGGGMVVVGGEGSCGAEVPDASKDAWAGDDTEEYSDVGLLTADAGLAPSTPKAAAAGVAAFAEVGAGAVALEPNTLKAAAAGLGAGAVALEPNTFKAAAAGLGDGVGDLAPKTPKAAAAAPVE